MSTLVIYWGADVAGCAVYKSVVQLYEGSLPTDYVIDMLAKGNAINAISWRVF